MVIIDELHALASTKRGDLLALDLARLRTLSPGLTPSACRRRWRGRPSLPLSSSAMRGRRARGSPRSSRPARGQRPTSPSSTPMPSFPGPDTRRAMRSLRSTRRSRRTACRSSSSTRARRQRCCFMRCGATTMRTCPSRCITARSMSASGGRSRRRWWRASSAPWFAPRRSISASTGAMSISSSMSARRKAQAGLPSASAAPITGSTSRQRRCSCRRTASRWWSARRRSRRRKRARRTRPRRGRARSMFLPSMCSAWPAPSRSIPTRFIAK